MSNRNYVYSNMEYVQMVRLYAVSGDNLRETRRLYAAPENLTMLRNRGVINPQVPGLQVILAATQRLIDHGAFRTPAHARGGGRPRHSLVLEDDILEYFELHPRRSTRMAARHFGVSRYYVWKVLHVAGLHPYHYRRAQALYGSDSEARIRFCQWLIANPAVNILWTDESTFTRVGIFNIHNEHWWTMNNPHLIKEHSHQIRFSVNVWAGLLNNRIFGPIFIEGNLTGGTYLNMLQGVCDELLDDVPLRYLWSLYYQHDGCPAHYARAVRDYLDREFGDRWIGRGGPVAWPPRSPDLTPMDFYLWSEIKRLVYTEEARSVEQFKGTHNYCFRSCET